jgi:DNA polymerase III alpha subunit (gram-positive type)
MVKERQINPRSLENLKLGKTAGNKKKIRFNTTLLPETITWLKGCGNASDTIDALVTNFRDGRFGSSFNQYKPKSNNTHDEISQQAEAIRIKTKSNNTHDEISQQAEALKVRTRQLESQLAATEAERDQLRQQLAASQSQQPDLEGDRDRYLVSLRLGRQAPEYKRVKKALDNFIAFIRLA